MTASVWAGTKFRELDPRTLLIDQNRRTIRDIRQEAPELVASIEEIGVQIPVIVVATSLGLRVKDGHSRTLAALHAGHDTIPAIVTTTADPAAQEQIEFLLAQWAANETRRGFSTADKARFIDELMLFGVPEAELARKMGTTTETLSAAVKVQRSEKAAAAMHEHPQLDMLQVAALVEFGDDPDASEELQKTLDDDPAQFDQVVAEIRLRRAEQAARDAAAAELRDAGVTVVDAEYTTTLMPLRRLRRSAEDHANLADDPEAHAQCPGHAAVVATTAAGDTSVKYVCQDWHTHGHLDAWASTSSAARGPKSQREKDEMRRVRENNAAWRAAKPRRRKWMTDNLLTGKAAPKRAQQQLMRVLLEGGPHLTQAISRGNTLAAQLLGCKGSRGGRGTLAAKATRATADQALIMNLAIVLGGLEEAYEAKDSVNTWRRPTSEDRLFFELLASWDYPASKVEQLVCNPKADAHDWQHLADNPVAEPIHADVDLHDECDDEEDGCDVDEQPHAIADDTLSHSDDGAAATDDAVA